MQATQKFNSPAHIGQSPFPHLLKIEQMIIRLETYLDSQHSTISRAKQRTAKVASNKIGPGVAPLMKMLEGFNNA